MHGPQDMGGRHGFGPIAPEKNEPVFHDEWERRAFALTVAMGFTGQWNIDAARHARETMDPAHYLSSSYYQIWLAGLQKLLVQRGLASREEIADGRSKEKPVALKHILAGGDVEKMLDRGGPTERDESAPARFAVGDKIRARNMHPPTHTRLPGYACGRIGTIDRVHGAHVFPDTNARFEGEQPQWLYSVKFAAEELWGGEDPDGDEVFIDLWESYLEPA